MDSFYQRFLNAHAADDMQTLSGEVQEQGYSLINQWLIRLEKELEEAGEDDFPRVARLLATARRILPHPQQYSPLWDKIWDDLEDMFRLKQRVFEQIPAGDRFGEWQLLFDNPHSTEGMVAHVNLPFAKAAYLFAKYRKDLKKFEYISLQRVQRFITEFGD